MKSVAGYVISTVMTSPPLTGIVLDLPYYNSLRGFYNKIIALEAQYRVSERNESQIMVQI